MNQFHVREMSITFYSTKNYTTILIMVPSFGDGTSGGCTLIFLRTTFAHDKELFFSASKTRNWINIKLVHKKLLNHARKNTLRFIKRLTGWWDDIAWVSNHHCRWDKQKEKHRDYDKPNGSLGIHLWLNGGKETRINTLLLLWYIYIHTHKGQHCLKSSKPTSTHVILSFFIGNNPETVYSITKKNGYITINSVDNYRS